MGVLFDMGGKLAGLLPGAGGATGGAADEFRCVMKYAIAPPITTTATMTITISCLFWGGGAAIPPFFYLQSGQNLHGRDDGNKKRTFRTWGW